MKKTCLIVGAGAGLSASLARRFRADGYDIALAARNVDKLTALAAETKARTHACDVADIEDVRNLFDWLNADTGSLDVAIYNPSQRVRGGVETLDPNAVRAAIEVTAFGGFLVGQAAAKRMLGQGHGAILFTGASASVKGYANSSTFAMGKFALRGLAQSMARELAPANVHVAHFVIDGGIRSSARALSTPDSDEYLDPDAIADTYHHVAHQPRNAWTWEVELRPWVEKF